MNREPCYLETFAGGRLKEKAERARAAMSRCTLCPHRCGADRAGGGRGKCRTGMLPVVSACHPHFGEESVLVGRGGSGTIFFTNCNMACIFCQNYDISHLGRGEEVSYDDLARMMLSLQSKGCRNINLVSPTHMVHAVLEALLRAVPAGLRLPLVYNTGGYDSPETLEMLDGVVDIYMPDFKYMDPDAAGRLSGTPDYPTAACAALEEMHRQTGDLVTDARGEACRGLLVRHLVLPNNIAATDRVISFIAGLSANTCINIMDQYRPEYRARECFDLRRRITLQEYDDAVDMALKAGLKRIDSYRPL